MNARMMTRRDAFFERGLVPSAPNLFADAPPPGGTATKNLSDLLGEFRKRGSFQLPTGHRSGVVTGLVLPAKRFQ